MFPKFHNERGQQHWMIFSLFFPFPGKHQWKITATTKAMFLNVPCFSHTDRTAWQNILPECDKRIILTNQENPKLQPAFLLLGNMAPTGSCSSAGGIKFQFCRLTRKQWSSSQSITSETGRLGESCSTQQKKSCCNYYLDLLRAEQSRNTLQENFKLNCLLA